jgi:hypothetical protein
MSRKPAPPPDDPEQSQRFIDTAKEIGADESKEGFERVFGKIVKDTKKVTATSVSEIVSSRKSSPKGRS